MGKLYQYTEVSEYQLAVSHFPELPDLLSVVALDILPPHDAFGNKEGMPGTAF